MPVVDLEEQLLIEAAKRTHDPLDYTRKFYPWGKGELADSTGPRAWQSEVDAYIAGHFKNPETRFTPCRVAVSSGHGIGKSAELGQITNWAMSTCEDCKAVITAGTGTQLPPRRFRRLASG